ncbi:hypothetical protein CC79DRAFT_1218163 [Sarocladium strictum]
MPATPLKTRTACDQCRFRKLKCDGGFPCGRCAKMEFECSFNAQSTRNRRVAQLRGSNGQSSPSVSASNKDANDYNDDGMRSPGISHFEAGGRDLLHSDPISQHGRTGLPDAAYQPQDSHHSASQYVQSPEEDISWGRGSRTVPLDLSQDNGISVGATIRSNTSRQRWSISESQGHMPQATETVNAVSLLDPESQSPFNIPTGRSDPLITSPSTSTNLNKSASFSESEVLPWLDIFFARLYSTLPIVDQQTIYRDIMRGRQDTDRSFASMVLSLCALALVQPVFKAESPSMLARSDLARRMLSRALQARDFDFGEDMTTEAVIASFFMFAALYGLDRPKAAWLRLREAVECGQLIGLHRPETYSNLSREEQGQPFRLFLVLAVTERGYALQRNHCISFIGQHVEKMSDIYNAILADATTQVDNILVHDDKNITAMHGILQLMKLFDSIDEDVIPCWNRSCSPPLTTCTRLTVEHAHNVYESISNAMSCDSSSVGTNTRFFDVSTPVSSSSATTLNDIQWVDCFMLQQWLLVRLWVSCLTHDLIATDSELLFTRPLFPVDVAEKVLKQCEKVHTSVLEVHGLGMIERFHDIALAVVMSIQFCRDTDGDASTHCGHALLGRYFTLLQELRNGEHSFTSALRKAYESTEL